MLAHTTFTLFRSFIKYAKDNNMVGGLCYNPTVLNDTFSYFSKAQPEEAAKLKILFSHYGYDWFTAQIADHF